MYVCVYIHTYHMYTCVCMYMHIHRHVVQFQGYLETRLRKLHAALQASPHDVRAVLEQAVTELQQLSRQATEHVASSPPKPQTLNPKP